MKRLTISVIIPTYNEERLLQRCLRSLQKQLYPKELIEVIVVDDGSADQTLNIAKEYGAKVVLSGKKHIESSKSLGIAAATGDLLLFIDADIELVATDWLSVAVASLVAYPEAVGVQNIYWQYRKSDSLVNRYCELTGVNDPFVYMLKRRGILAPFERSWLDPRVVEKETDDYFVARFTPDRLPTLGSQGYLTRRSLIVQETDWQPYFFHLDTVAQLVTKGHGQFILLKRQVHHDYVQSLSQYFRKMQRNILLYLKYQPYRRYTYDTGSWRFIVATLTMVTLIRPLWQGLRGFRRMPDAAWLLHPLLCFVVPIIYTWAVIGWKVGYGKKI